MSILRSRALIVGATVVFAGAGVLTLLGAVLAIPLTGLVGYFVAAALDPPRPFTVGLLLGGVAAVAMALAWSTNTPTFSMAGEPPDQMGWQIPAIAMLVSVGLGGVVTKSFAVLFGPARS